MNVFTAECAFHVDVLFCFSTTSAVQFDMHLEKKVLKFFDPFSLFYLVPCDSADLSQL